MLQKTVGLENIRDIDIKEITVRAVNGEDTMEAASRCIPPDGSPLDGNLFGLMMRQQMVAQGIVSYVGADGARVDCKGAPCTDMMNWSSRTREFVGEVFDYLNGVEAAEREAFRKALSKSTPGSPSTASAV